MTHTNSTAAHATEQKTGGITRRAQAILDQAATATAPFTDRAMAARLGYTDMNSVRPRITELHELGLLVECGSTRCPVTRKTVRLSRRPTPAEIRARIQAEATTQTAEQLPLL